jgi:ADP-heptose:LPS heptosyltransferase
MKADSIKFLIVRFSSIGDIILTTPVIRMIKQQVENAEVHYLTKKNYQFILEANPYVDKIHVYEDNLPQLVEKLNDEKIDYVIDLHNNIRSHTLKRKLQLPTFCVDKLNWQKWLLVNLKIDRLPKIHIVDRYLQTCSVFDVVQDDKGLDYFIPEGEKLNANQLPASPYIAFVIGGQHFTKKMPAEKIAEICSGIPYPIILLGGKEDLPEAEKIIRLCAGNQLINGCGFYSFHQSASIVQQAGVIITHDTGLMHVAAAFNKKIISIWGNTIPEFGMYPYLPHPDSFQAEVKNLSCRPCSKIGYSSCPKKHFNCMNLQSPQEISRKAIHLISSLDNFGTV